MNLGFLHPALAGLVVEKGQHVVQGLLGIVQNIGKSPPLAVLEKLLTGDAHSRHIPLPGAR